MSSDDPRPTPPPKPSDIGYFLAGIKDDLNEIKPNVQKTREDVAALRVDLNSTKGRVKALETKTEGVHTIADCPNTSATAEIREGQSSLSLKVNTAEANIAEQSTDLEEQKKSSSKFIYWAIAAVIGALGSGVAWYASTEVTENNVRHLSSEQSKIRQTLESLSATNKAQTKEMEQTTSAVEAVSESIKTNGDHKRVPVDVWYMTLSDDEKRLLKRRGINIPLVEENATVPVSAPAME